MGGVIRNKVAKVLSGALIGFDGALIEVETDIKAGLPGLQIVGMGNKAIDEARQRVRSAISNSLLTFPPQKLTVNLAPAELPKDGTHLDLPIALSVLVASGQLKQAEVANSFFAGELALNGSLRPIRGVVLLTEMAKENGLSRIFLPAQNVAQAEIVSGIEVIGINSLKGLYGGLKGVTGFNIDRSEAPNNPSGEVLPLEGPTFDDIIGHEQAKRALIIAASGRHNVLFTGPPGTGKTLLARSLASILPQLNEREIIEVTKLHGLYSNLDTRVHTRPPFRSPHHSATLTSLIGGGLKPRPGDASLAHKGVLFLDELPEYSRASLEALRQPLEDRVITLSRLYGHITYPADILLLATMNPCPCGYWGDKTTICTCLPGQIASYQKRISGPLLDRIDIRLTISRTTNEHFFDSVSLRGKQHFKVLKLVLIARNAQKERYKRSGIYNAYASLNNAKQLFNVTSEAKDMLNLASKKMDLSSRSYLRILRVARTIADLERSKDIAAIHIAEALQYR